MRKEKQKIDSLKIEDLLVKIAQDIHHMHLIHKKNAKVNTFNDKVHNASGNEKYNVKGQDGVIEATKFNLYCKTKWY